MQHHFIIETERLRLREMNESDAEFVFELNLNPLVTQYTGDDPFSSIEGSASFLRSYDAYKKTGMGRWGVELKKSNELIGWSGLKFHFKDDTYDLGFRFLQAHWGKGYATESGLACLKYGFEKLELPRIYAEARVENTRSLNVIQKLGFKFCKDGTDCGGKTSIFELYKTQFNR